MTTETETEDLLALRLARVRFAALHRSIWPDFPSAPTSSLRWLALDAAGDPPNPDGPGRDGGRLRRGRVRTCETAAPRARWSSRCADDTGTMANLFDAAWADRWNVPRRHSGADHFSTPSRT